MFGCFVVMFEFLNSPLSNFLNVNLPSSPSLSKITSTLLPQNSKIPDLYDLKKKVKISLKLSEYLFSFLSFLEPMSFFRFSLSSLVTLRPAYS